MAWDGKEEDLYLPVKKLLEQGGYEVKAEVGSCDVIAKRGETVVAVELKKTLNLDVILQATLMQKTSDLSFVAVPKPSQKYFNKRFNNICHLLRRLELGLILVTQTKKELYADIFIEPVPFERDASIRKAKKRKLMLLNEFKERSGDYNVGGSARKKRITAYRERAIQIAVLLSKNGPMSTKTLRENGTNPKNTTSILADNHYGWFERVSHGVYSLTKQGEAELNEFSLVAKRYEEI